ncbi:MAG: alpha/beta fold hydrolase [Candidatus Binataceae bacterium]
MPTVDANGCKMFYEIDDFTDPWTSDKETVWLQHGVGRSTKFWYHWVPALAREYRVIRRDMRGHGQSSAPPSGHKWSLDELAEDMLAFMDAMGLERVHYLGESIGGIVGILFATRWPERFKSLTICNSPTELRRAEGPALSGTRGSVSNILANEGSRGWGRLLIEQRVISGNSLAHKEWVLNEVAKTPAHVLQGVTRTLDGADTSPLLPQVKVPTLVLAPSRSPITWLSDQIKMRTLIPNARIAVIEGPGHEIYVDRAEECVDAFLKFLRALN